MRRPWALYLRLWPGRPRACACPRPLAPLEASPSGTSAQRKTRSPVSPRFHGLAHGIPPPPPPHPQPALFALPQLSNLRGAQRARGYRVPGNPRSGSRGFWTPADIPRVLDDEGPK